MFRTRYNSNVCELRFYFRNKKDMVLVFLYLQCVVRGFVFWDVISLNNLREIQKGYASASVR